MREHVRAATVANEARMIRQAIPHVAIAIVEGTDDKLLYGKFVDTNHCKIVVAYGKPHALGALDILRKAHFFGVVLILDADHDRLLCVAGDPDVLTTDHHDAEMMMIGSPALDAVLAEFGDPARLTEFVGSRGAVVDELLSLARPLGRARLFARQRGQSLRFEGLEFDAFVCRRAFTVDSSALHRKVQELSRIGLIPEEPFASRPLDSDPPSLRDLCCGHDVVQLLSIGLSRVLGVHNQAEVAPARLERALRLAYETAHFVLTQLWQLVKRWESQNAPYRVLR